MVEIISAAKREADLADSIVMRTHEVYQYDQNIANYESMLTTLPTDEWPSTIVHLRGMPSHEAAALCDPAYVEDLSRYQLRDQVASLIKSEKVERDKAAAILAAVDAQLTGPNRDTALQAAVDRRESIV